MYPNTRTWTKPLRDQFAKHGPWRPSELAKLDAAAVALTFGQPTDGPAYELMGLYARALNELGVFLSNEHMSRFSGPVRLSL